MEEQEKYCAVIGLEVHVQLATKRKMFTIEGATYGQPPNTQTSPITLAHPGTMPTINKQAISYAIMMGLACQSTITNYNWFDRKNYFYPDLPKGFQITQDKTPICRHGHIVIETPQHGEKHIQLTRIHLEEDTGKSIHTPQGNLTLVNFDRAGQPLIEIVTEPDLRTAEEASAFLTTIRRLVRHLGISNGKMEEGSLRCDANVSIMPRGSTTLGTKVELKNMNSIRHVRLGIIEEIQRQKALKSTGREVLSETRSYDVQTGKNLYQRTKEGLTNYRYFTEPDLTPFTVSNSWIADIQQQMPTLPRALVAKFTGDFSLPTSDATILTEDKETSLFFEAICQHTQYYKIAANWVIGPIKSYFNTEKLTWVDFPLSPKAVAQLANMVGKNIIGFSLAVNKVFPQLLKAPTDDPYQLIKTQALQVDDQEQLRQWVEQALAAHPAQVTAYHQGKKGLFGFFMGEVMRKSQRKANPEKTAQLLRQKLAPTTP